MKVPNTMNGFFCAAALICAMVALSAPDLHAAWTGATADNQIGFDDDSYASYIRIAVSPTDLLHLAWSEDNPRFSADEIHYGQSNDGGGTWSCSSADTVISHDDDEGVWQSNDIAVDGAGNIYVVWSEDEPEPSGQNEILVTYSSDSGSTWSAVTAASDVVISDPLQDAASFNPGIAVGSNNTIHVVYHKTDPQVGFAKIYTTRSTDGGATWSAVTGGDQVITDVANAFSDSTPAIAVDSNGTIFVTYKKYLGTGVGSQFFVTSSTDNGVTWSGTTAETPVSTAFSIAQYPFIAVDSNDVVHVIWEASDETASPYHYEVYHSRSTDGGLTWSAVATPSMISYENAGGDSAHNAKIATDHCGSVCVVWDEAPVDGGTNEIMVSQSTDGGVTWSGSTADELISFPDNENGYRPCVVALSDNTWIVAWSEFEGGSGAGDNYEVHLSIGDPLCASSTVACSYTCVPNAGTVPFSTTMTATLINNYTGLQRRVAARVDVVIGNGSSFSNWKSGWSNVAASSSFVRSWNQAIPSLGSVIGDNVFTLSVEDVTPAPYNQAPHPPSGDTDVAACTVTAVAP